MTVFPSDSWRCFATAAEVYYAFFPTRVLLKLPAPMTRKPRSTWDEPMVPVIARASSSQSLLLSHPTKGKKKKQRDRPSSPLLDGSTTCLNTLLAINRFVEAASTHQCTVESPRNLTQPPPPPSNCPSATPHPPTSHALPPGKLATHKACMNGVLTSGLGKGTSWGGPDDLFNIHS